MQRIGLLAIVLFLLSACRIVTPIEPSVTPTAQMFVQDSPLPSGTPTLEPPNAPTSRPNAPTSRALTPTTTPQPTATLTPQPTLTTIPTVQPTTAPVGQPAITITRPVAGEFVTSPVTVVGTIANATGGTVLISLRTLDGQPIGPDAAAAATSAAADGLQFAVEMPLELPPTPRQLALIVQYAAEQGGQPVIEAGQAINLLGRYGRVDRIIVEAPKPLERPAEAQISVQGVAPGPPAKILARLLDDADQVIESVEATFSWYQPGLPCAWSALVPNNPAGTQLQIITLGPDDAVLDNVRVRLNPR